MIQRKKHMLYDVMLYVLYYAALYLLRDVLLLI